MLLVSGSVTPKLGDGHQPKSVGVYPIIRIPVIFQVGGFPSHPQGPRSWSTLVVLWIKDGIHSCHIMTSSLYYCWWVPEIRDQLTSWGTLVVEIPLFIGFQHHPRWLGMGFQPSRVVCPMNFGNGSQTFFFTQPIFRAQCLTLEFVYDFLLPNQNKTIFCISNSKPLKGRGPWNHSPGIFQHHNFPVPKPARKQNRWEAHGDLHELRTILETR